MRQITIQATLAPMNEKFKTFSLESETLEFFDFVEYENDSFIVVGVDGKFPYGIEKHDAITPADVSKIGRTAKHDAAEKFNF